MPLVVMNESLWSWFCGAVGAVEAPVRDAVERGSDAEDVEQAAVLVVPGVVVQ